jgi:prepilin-type N-terminal cleavage/methylation domain-containing protein
MKRVYAQDERGFTVVELLVCVLLIAALLAVATFLLRPKSYAAEDRNAKRWLDTAQLVQALAAYHAANGALPAGITGKAQTLGSSSGQVDLCAPLVPRYLKDVPVDPAGYEISYGSRNCLGSDTVYDAGYTVSLSGGRLTVTAPSAELKKHISISRTF